MSVVLVSECHGTMGMLSVMAKGLVSEGTCPCYLSVETDKGHSCPLFASSVDHADVLVGIGTAYLVLVHGADDPNLRKCHGTMNDETSNLA